MAAPKLDEIEAEIIKIFEDCKAQGMSKAEILEVFSPLGFPNYVSKQISMKKEQINKKFRNILFTFLLAVVIGYAIVRSGEAIKGLRFHALAILRIGLIKLLPFWNWTEMYYSRCLVKNPFFEAPNNLNLDDCNLCESLEEIVRVANISQGRVIEDFIKRERPFIVRDGMEDWEVMNTDQFWFDNITEIYLRQDNYQVCNVNSNLRVTNGGFTKLLKKLYNPRTREWFVHWENCQKELAKAVRQYYRRPYFVSNSLDFTGSNWVLMSSDFKGRVYKKIEGTESLLMLYQVRGFNHVRISPKETCRGHCPELSVTLNEGEILVVTNLLWNVEYIPGEDGDNLAFLVEVSWPAME